MGNSIIDHQQDQNDFIDLLRERELDAFRDRINQLIALRAAAGLKPVKGIFIDNSQLYSKTGTITETIMHKFPPPPAVAYYRADGTRLNLQTLKWEEQ